MTLMKQVDTIWGNQFEKEISTSRNASRIDDIPCWMYGI